MPTGLLGGSGRIARVTGAISSIYRLVTKKQIKRGKAQARGMRET